MFYSTDNIEVNNKLKEFIEEEKERVSDFKSLYGKEPQPGETLDTKRKEFEERKKQKGGEKQ